MLRCFGSAVFHWWSRPPITPHHDVAIAASLMVLRSLDIALCGVELGPLNLGGEGLKIRINDERDLQLLVVVLKEDFGRTLFRHLHPHGCLAYPTTVGSVGFQQILPCVALQAGLPEVLALLVLALVIEETVEVLDPVVVKFAGLFNQQQIYAGHSIRLGAEPLNSHTLIPTKYVNGQVIQLLHFWDLRDGRGGIDPLKVQTIFVGVPSWSPWVMWWWWICPSKICQSHSKRPSKTVVIPVFHVDNCLLRPYSCWEWDVRAASQWLISSDVQSESLHSVDHPLRPSLRPLFKQLQEVGDGLV